jgi:hypothetical protein
MIGSARDDKQFRRGVVLGLTMAEALLLLIFLLMLILGIRLKTQSNEIAALEKSRDEAQSTLLAMQPVFDKLSKTQKFDITKDYVRVQQQLADANARLKTPRSPLICCSRRLRWRRPRRRRNRPSGRC